jgi:hypothetical protein
MLAEASSACLKLNLASLLRLKSKYSKHENVSFEEQEDSNLD